MPPVLDEAPLAGRLFYPWHGQQEGLPVSAQGGYPAPSPQRPRQRLHRFKHLGETLKKLYSPTLEKALTFLDDKLLPSTSNAVERGNRRYRKMQKSIYSVRTQDQIQARIALDMWREAQGEGREQTLEALHEARAG
jgi:hypothetical protein